MAVSNVRPWAIFSGYMVLAAALTAKSVAIIRSQNRASFPKQQQQQQGGPADSARRRAISVFGLLAALSLATTWYHMFRFFQWSYVQWAIAHVFAGDGMTGGTAEGGLRLGEWLRDTSLFKQAWASTLETGPRAWWSLQIFGFCANWSVLLAVQARKRSIPRAWIFVLLGQVVAISFAANLSFLAILCSAAPSRATSKGNGRRERDTTASGAISWHTVVLIVTLLWATSIPSAIDRPGFLSLLLGPHVLAFVPLLLNNILPSRMLGEPASFWKVASMVLVLAVAFKGVIDEDAGLDVVLGTLYEHPAVSSVGWDVICCWISFGAWMLIGVE